MKNQQQYQQPKITNQRKAPPIDTINNNASSSSYQNPIFFFPFGSEIEVTSDEEGFKDAWYSATIVQPPPALKQEQGKIYVEYKTLLSDENRSTLLKEFVHIQFVRPKPPIDQVSDTKNVSFEVNDVVDAFYRDGWWCGVVTQLLPQDKYMVFFSNPPDEIQFHFNDLRLHKDWIHGNWLLPQKQRMRELKCIPGTTVEVNIDPDNSCDVWFPATFLKQVANNFLVEYKASKEAEPQKIAVDYLRIRPLPPCSSHKAFNLLEKVDAFYESHWLSGVVTKIIADGRYIVYFKHTKKEKELSHTDLRLHMEWNNGKWIQSSQEILTTSNSEKQSNTVVNGSNKEKTCAPPEGSDAVKNNVSSDRISTTNLRSGQKELLTLGNEKTNHNSTTPSNKRVKQTSANGDACRSRTLRRTNEEPASDVTLFHERCISKMKHVEQSDHETPADFDFPTSGHRAYSGLKQGENSSQHSDPTEVKDGNDKLSAPRKRGRPPKLRATVSGDALGETVVKTPDKSDVVKPAFGSIVIGLTHNGKMIDSLGGTSIHNLNLEHKKAVDNEEKNMDDHESVGSEQPKESEATNLKRKRGRPFKKLLWVDNPRTNEAESTEQKKDDASDAKDDDERYSPSEVGKPIAIVQPSEISDSVPDSHIRHAMKVSDQMKQSSDMRWHSMRSTSRKQIRKRKVSTGLVMHDLNEPVESVKKGKKQKSSKQVESQTEDALNNLRIKAIEVFSNGVDRAVARTSSNGSDDDRPLSTWFEGAVSPLATDFRVPAGGTVDQSDGSAERAEIRTALVDQVKERDKTEYTSVEIVSQALDKNGSGRPEDIAMQSQTTAIVPTEERDLPFVKNSLIWKLIENMEVLKRIPQKPHFRPLYNCKEECREGLAIGSMVTFTSLVERISKSRFSDSRCLLDGYIEALVDLEELGFNVSPVRELLNNLICLKDKYEQAQNTAKEIESQIMERNLEKSTINGEMVELDRKIAELMEKRALVMSKKERKEAEIALLKMSIDAVKGTLDTSEKEFEKITSSLW